MLLEFQTCIDDRLPDTVYSAIPQGHPLRVFPKQALSFHLLFPAKCSSSSSLMVTPPSPQVTASHPCLRPLRLPSRPADRQSYLLTVSRVCPFSILLSPLSSFGPSLTHFPLVKTFILSILLALPITATRHVSSTLTCFTSESLLHCTSCLSEWHHFAGLLPDPKL